MSLAKLFIRMPRCLPIAVAAAAKNGTHGSTAARKTFRSSKKAPKRRAAAQKTYKERRHIHMELIYAIIGIILLAILVVGAFVLKFLFAQKGASDAGQVAVKAACDVASTLLDQVLFGAVTVAEREWGSGTGAAKLDAVREKILSLLPENLRALVPAGWLQRVIESGLAAAKQKWAANPALVGVSTEDVTAKFEQLKDALCPVGYHWEPNGDGGFVTVLDAPAEEATAPPDEEPAGE